MTTEEIQKSKELNQNLENILQNAVLPLILLLDGVSKSLPQKQFFDKTIRVNSVNFETKNCIVQFLRTDRTLPYWSKEKNASICEIAARYILPIEYQKHLFPIKKQSKEYQERKAYLLAKFRQQPPLESPECFDSNDTRTEILKTKLINVIEIQSNSVLSITTFVVDDENPNMKESVQQNTALLLFVSKVTEKQVQHNVEIDFSEAAKNKIYTYWNGYLDQAYTIQIVENIIEKVYSFTCSPPQG